MRCLRSRLSPLTYSATNSSPSSNLKPFAKRMYCFASRILPSHSKDAVPSARARVLPGSKPAVHVDRICRNRNPSDKRWLRIAARQNQAQSIDVDGLRTSSIFHSDHPAVKATKVNTASMYFFIKSPLALAGASIRRKVLPGSGRAFPANTKAWHSGSSPACARVRAEMLPRFQQDGVR